MREIYTRENKKEDNIFSYDKDIHSLYFEL